jgi:hypothetical protein
MLTGAQIGILFMVLALLFFGLSLRDYLKSAGKKTPARRAWMRVRSYLHNCCSPALSDKYSENAVVDGRGE